VNIRRLWVKLALLFVVAATVGFAIPSTLAYLTAQSDTLVNTFTAPYFPPESASVEVRVHKTVHNIGTESIGPEGFQFKLQNTQNDEAFTLTADVNGFASVTLPFSDADLGKTHTYRLQEINDGRANVTYSDAVYSIQITLSVNADNQIIASVMVDDRPVQQVEAVFENTYNAGTTVPLTGDKTQIGLYAALMLLSGACILLLLTKRAGRVIR